MNRTIITGAKARDHHTAAVRLVVHGNREEWTRFLILDRSKVLREFRRYRELGYDHGDAFRLAICPQWASGDSGPGRSFSRLCYRLKTGRRWIVWTQSGGLDV